MCKLEFSSLCCFYCNDIYAAFFPRFFVKEMKINWILETSQLCRTLAQKGTATSNFWHLIFAVRVICKKMAYESSPGAFTYLTLNWIRPAGGGCLLKQLKCSISLLQLLNTDVVVNATHLGQRYTAKTWAHVADKRRARWCNVTLQLAGTVERSSGSKRWVMRRAEKKGNRSEKGREVWWWWSGSCFY